MKCTWCGRGRMHKHSDPVKAKQGITVCDTCNMAHSPNATIKGSYAFFNGTRFVHGVRRK